MTQRRCGSAAVPPPRTLSLPRPLRDPDRSARRASYHGSTSVSSVARDGLKTAAEDSWPRRRVAMRRADEAATASYRRQDR